MTAARIAPDDPYPLVLLYATFVAIGEKPMPDSVDGLYRAGQSALHDPDLRVLVAYQSLADGKAAQARKLLALIASDPRSVEIGMRTKPLIDVLEQRGVAAALEAFDKDDLVEVIARL
jgi:hypothetical protein